MAAVKPLTGPLPVVILRIRLLKRPLHTIMRRWLLLLLLVTRSHAFAGHNGKRLARPTAIYSTRVYYRDRSEDEEQWTATATQPKKSGINVPMIRGICLGQLSTLLVATFLAMASGVDLDAMQWTDTATANSMFDGSLTTLRVGMGVAAAIPMILWSGLVEDSSKRDATHVNFATTNLVVSLFGRRHHDSSGPTTTTLEVIGLSTLLTLVTALSEEIVFRGYVPVALSTVIPSLPAVLLLQACFFGWSHVHPASKKGENQVVASLQTMNGLWHGAVYLMTGGDLLPCIIRLVAFGSSTYRRHLSHPSGQQSLSLRHARAGRDMAPH